MCSTHSVDGRVVNVYMKKGVLIPAIFILLGFGVLIILVTLA